MQKTWNVPADRCPETLDLFFRNRSPLPFASYESEHSRRLQYLQPLLNTTNNADEGITAKHRDFHLDPAVAPLVDLTEEGKECAHALLFKLRSNPLFAPCHRVNGIPVQFLRSAIERRKVRPRFKVY